MKKLIGLLLFAIIMVTACDNSEDEEVKPNVFKFKVNGVEKDYSANIDVDFVDLFELTTISASDGKDTLQIELNSTSTGTFETPEQFSLLDNGLRYMSGDYSFTTVTSHDTVEYTINISTYTGMADEVEGTFSGRLRHSNYDFLNPYDSVITITSGEFYVTK